MLEFGLDEYRILEFKLDDYRIISPRAYYQFLAETFILDVYRAGELLRENDLVLDLGATMGDFSVFASKKVGNNGKVIAIEPDPDSYEILKKNIERNNCQNIVAVNVGIGSAPEEKDITFITCGISRTYRCKLNSLENILEELDIRDKINFIKMDIEGFEAEVVFKSLKTIKEANVISVEFHGTKQKLDELLIPNGFSYRPITMRYVYKNLLKHLLLHPITFSKAAVYMIDEIPTILGSIFTGFDMTKSDYLLTGSYVRGR
jgi:FkbM family methyltransferase